MIKADMLYQIHLRLGELLEKPKQPFGGCAVILFGDILQLKPVMGKYIFDLPRSSDYHAYFNIDSLWNTFNVVQLLTNHRQGEDHTYAELLNRVRTGSQNANDYKLLQERVRPLNHPDIPKDALFVTCFNKDVNTINAAKLDQVEGQLIEIQAKISSTAQKEPKTKTSNDGSIFNTPLQKHLALKKGAKVMLTSNIDTMDCLTNGAMGKVVDFIYDQKGAVKTILVHFKDEKVGKQTRLKHPNLQQQYPEIQVFPIQKFEFKFSLSKKQTNNQMLTALQFPLKLCFACTAHKVQGLTVAKPNSLIVDLRGIREPAQGYVMLSRVQALNQLYIIEEIPADNLYPSKEAVKELMRLFQISDNNNELRIRQSIAVSSLNIRSLPDKIQDLRVDYRLIQSSIICLQETWCEDLYSNDHLNIEGYHLYLTNQGRGKGIATYVNPGYTLSGEVNMETYQMIKFSCKDIHVINVYRSQNANTTMFLDSLNSLIDGCDQYFIVGDFNIDISNTFHPIVTSILSKGFRQLVQFPTHEQGGIIDHVYVRSSIKVGLQDHWPYYSDHCANSVVLLPNVI